jgi:hypothetical protein
MGTKKPRGTRRRRAEGSETGKVIKRADAQSVFFLKDGGVLLLRNPELFRPGREEFCRRLADAAVRQEEVRTVRISLASGTCRIAFEPGRVDEAGMADRFTRAVRSAVDQGTRDGRSDGADAGWTSLVMFATDEGRSAPGTGVRSRARAESDTGRPCGTGGPAHVSEKGRAHQASFTRRTPRPGDRSGSGAATLTISGSHHKAGAAGRFIR